MYNTLLKNFNLSCFSKFKCLPSNQQQDPPPILFQEQEYHDKKSLNSVYDLTSASTSSSAAEDLFSSSSDDSPPDFATVFASQRFFFSSPGRSNSIVESSPPPDTPQLLDGGVAVPTYSPDPYMDFRRSMQEMIEAREAVVDVTADWEYLHELLLCYLTLNPKNTHKIIVRAFSDLLVSLLSSPSSDTDYDRKLKELRQRALGPRLVGVN